MNVPKRSEDIVRDIGRRQRRRRAQITHEAPVVAGSNGNGDPRFKMRIEFHSGDIHPKCRHRVHAQASRVVVASYSDVGHGVSELGEPGSRDRAGTAQRHEKIFHQYFSPRGRKRPVPLQNDVKVDFAKQKNLQRASAPNYGVRYS